MEMHSINMPHPTVQYNMPSKYTHAYANKACPAGVSYSIVGAVTGILSTIAGVALLILAPDSPTDAVKAGSYMLLGFGLTGFVVSTTYQCRSLPCCFFCGSKDLD